MNTEWDLFISGEDQSSIVNPVIYKSWIRSRENKVDPWRIHYNDILTKHELHIRCQANTAIIEASKTVLPLILDCLNDSEHLVLICDKDGYILDAYGDPTFLGKAQKVQVSCGANWREDLKGTNAIGTLLVEKTPLVIWGREHFIQAVQFINCWAAPIFDNMGETVGLINIAAEVGTNDNGNLLQVAMMGTKLIEQNLHLQMLEERFLFHQEGIRLVSEMLRNGFIEIKNSGVISEINHAGARLIGRKREEIIGKMAVDVFQNKSWSISNKALDIQSNEIHGNGIISRLRRVMDDTGSVIGAVGVLLPSTNLQPDTPLWVGRSEKTKDVITRADKIAATSSTVLIQGESGTGKEIITRYIHQLSARWDHPFVVINCASIPASLIESELFGYVDGAFTGAKRGGQQGKFEIATRGTLFLDEIGDMPLSLQASLLRVLQEKEIYRVGDTQAKKVDVRVIAATNKDLEMLIKSGHFRSDLYYRLKVVTVKIPPLRDRMEDILDLVPYFIKKICYTLGRPAVDISDEVLSSFLAYQWPGNIRELENCLEGMIITSENDILNVTDLPDTFNKSTMLSQERHSLLDKNAKQTIIQALGMTKGKVAPAAKILGITRKTLYKKIKEYNINH